MGGLGSGNGHVGKCVQRPSSCSNPECHNCKQDNCFESYTLSQILLASGFNMDENPTVHFPHYQCDGVKVTMNKQNLFESFSKSL